MTTPGYSRAEASGAGNREPATIVSVVPSARLASALLRTRYLISVNTSFAVGDSIITPAIGEQWYVERFDQVWRLAGRIPANDPTMNIEPEPGQVSIGSASGPLEMNGTELRANGPLRLSCPDTRPAPGVGVMIYDPALKKPLFGDGSIWRDANGTPA